MVANLKEIEVGFETPPSLFGLPLPKLSWKGKLIPSDAEQRLAWGLYIELTTRIAVAGLAPSEGSLREALETAFSFAEQKKERDHTSSPRNQESEVLKPSKTFIKVEGRTKV